jgi:hypothetical protein
MQLSVYEERRSNEYQDKVLNHMRGLERIGVFIEWRKQREDQRNDCNTE